MYIYLAFLRNSNYYRYNFQIKLDYGTYLLNVPVPELSRPGTLEERGVANDSLVLIEGRERLSATG